VLIGVKKEGLEKWGDYWKRKEKERTTVIDVTLETTLSGAHPILLPTYANMRGVSSFLKNIDKSP
jgi:hypothetical protein